MFYHRAKTRLKHYINMHGKYKFTDRQHDYDKMLLIIAGYKPYLYDTVFKRVQAFVDTDIDVCIVSSGLYDTQLAKIAESNHWSYLSTKRNCVCLAQNIAIMLHPQAQWIYKMDEDIFVTRNSFSNLLATYQKAEKDAIYDVGFAAPLIPINGYGHVRILDKLGKRHIYEEKFQEAKYASYPSRMIESNPEVAKFFWGATKEIPSVDEMNEQFAAEPLSYTVCPIRFSIGFILMHRNTWKKMGMWRVPLRGSGMGADEAQICTYCVVNSQAIIVSDNVVVGHMSFGKQNAPMRQYYLEHHEQFDVKG